MYKTEKTYKANKSAFIWNTIGSVSNALSSLIYLMIVTRTVGADDAGVFAIAFANAQLMLTIGRYGMRAFQSTDIKGQYSFGTYLSSRVVTSVAMLFTSMVYILFSDFSPYKSQIVLWVCILKMIDAMEDIFHGILQIRNNLDIAGKLQTIRNVFSMVAFFLIILFTRNLLLSCVLTSILSFVLCLGINICFVKKHDKIKLDFSFQPLKSLLVECFPLFAASFLSLYIYNTPKYAIDRYLTEEIQTYYGIIFMPAFVINLLSEFVFKPLLTHMADLWTNLKVKELLNTILKLLTGIIVLTIVVLLGGYFLGIPILSFVYGVDLRYYKSELMILLLGGGFGASVWLLNNVLTTMRKQKGLLLGYLIVSIITSVLSPILVREDAITGAALSYLCSIGILFVILIIMLLHYINKVKVGKLNESTNNYTGL
jgi:O-antigen/teichoic acid export membrane protein